MQLLESEMAGALCKQSIELKLLLAQCHFYRRDSEKADQALRSIVSQNPEDWTSLCLLLDLYLPLNKDKLRGPCGPSWQSLCRETCQLTENLGSADAPHEPWPESCDASRAADALNFIQAQLKGSLGSWKPRLR